MKESQEWRKKQTYRQGQADKRKIKKEGGLKAFLFRSNALSFNAVVSLQFQPKQTIPSTTDHSRGDSLSWRPAFCILPVWQCHAQFLPPIRPCLYSEVRRRSDHLSTYWGREIFAFLPDARTTHQEGPNPYRPSATLSCLRLGPDAVVFSSGWQTFQAHVSGRSRNRFLFISFSFSLPSFVPLPTSPFLALPPSPPTHLLQFLTLHICTKK